LGLHLSGWKGLFAIERNRHAFSTLKANLIDSKRHFDWPDWLPKKAWNIQRLLKTKSDKLVALRGTVDLVVGGPPCQGFSMAGRRKESDKRNQLIHSYLKFVEIVQPRAILFENVRGFTMKFRSKRGNGIDYSQLVIEELRKLGYPDAHGEILNMADYGVPQRRQRFIVIGTRNNLTKDIFARLKQIKKPFLLAKGIPIKNTSRAALSDLEKRHGLIPCPDSKGFESGVAARPTTGIQKYLRRGQTKPSPNSHRFVNHTSKVTSVFTKLLAGAPRNKTINGSNRAQYGLKKRSVSVLDPKDRAPTVTTIPDDFIHYSEPRVMTVRECARLQSFPDWFEFRGPYTTGGKERCHQNPRYTQVGNAVPPLFAQIIGLATRKALQNV